MFGGPRHAAERQHGGGGAWQRGPPRAYRSRRRGRRAARARRAADENARQSDAGLDYRRSEGLHACRGRAPLGEARRGVREEPAEKELSRAKRVDPTIQGPGRMRSARVDFWVIGHRGSPEVEVENTIASFERALAEGANGLELDVCVTSDEEAVVWHDEDPHEWRARFRRLGLEPVVRHRPYTPRDRRYCRPVSELTLEELRTHFGYTKGPFG